MTFFKSLILHLHALAAIYEDKINEGKNIRRNPFDRSRLVKHVNNLEPYRAEPPHFRYTVFTVGLFLLSTWPNNETTLLPSLV